MILLVEMDTDAWQMLPVTMTIVSCFGSRLVCCDNP